MILPADFMEPAAAAGHAPPRQVAKLSVSTVLFDGYSDGVAFEEIARAGVAHAELAYIEGYTQFDESSFGDAQARQMAALMHRTGLSSFALSAHVNAGLPDAVERLARRVRFAHQIGAGILITNSTQKSRADAFLRHMTELSPLCAELGVTLALENPGHGTDDLIGSGIEGAALIWRIGFDHVRLNYDFGNIFTYHHAAVDVAQDIDHALPWMAHAHVKDVASDALGWRFAAIGDGCLDFKPIAAKLARLAPGMPIGLEMPLRLQCPGRGNPVRCAEPVALAEIRESLARAVAFWKSAMLADPM